MVQSNPNIIAIEGKDCATKIRIHYVLPVEVTRDIVSSLQFSRIEYNEFSKIVSGAKDHFKAAKSSDYWVTGVIGEAILVVTYGKLFGEKPSQEIKKFEQILSQFFQATIQYQVGSTCSIKSA